MLFKYLFEIQTLIYFFNFPQQGGWHSELSVKTIRFLFRHIIF